MATALHDQPSTSNRTCSRHRAIGSSGGKRNPRVPRGDIPSSTFVASAIITAAHTLQTGPLSDFWTKVDPETGRVTELRLACTDSRSGLFQPYDRRFIGGLPESKTDEHRRGVPANYIDPEGSGDAETVELASRYRQIALALALGAGGGGRVVALLALRMRHFLSVADINLISSNGWRISALNLSAARKYSGVVDISEQARQASRGKVWISDTKGSSKSRTVHLPALLPNSNGFGIGTIRPRIGAVVPRLLDPAVSLWEATEEESGLLWRHFFTPLNLLLWKRLRELFSDRAVRSLPIGSPSKEFRELLLLPTRNRARVGRDGQPNVQANPGWRKSTRIVEGAGIYMAQSNWAKLTNPLLDYVSEQLDAWPEHRTNSSQRNGWTHHELRHWAVSSRPQAGVPLPVIAREMGHSDSSFTLERYGPVLDGGTSPVGFEY